WATIAAASSASALACLPCAIHTAARDHHSHVKTGLKSSSLMSASASSIGNNLHGNSQDSTDVVPNQVKLGCAAAVSAASGLLDLLLQTLDNEAAAAESAVSECRALSESAPLARRPDAVSDRLTAARANANAALARLHRLRGRADAAVVALNSAVAAAFACDAEVACGRGAERLAAAEVALADLDKRLSGLRRHLIDATVEEIFDAADGADGGGDDGEDGEDDDDCVKS
ncbi:hypothetical protein BOX15_Mlig016688g1, partial [Macrostomum lignano]